MMGCLCATLILVGKPPNDKLAITVIYVLHAFQKKSQRTQRGDIELARQRYRQIEG
jgi:hypothetical protein